MTATNATKDRSINIRISDSQLNLIDRAASLERRSRSEFVLEVATRAAENVIFEQNVFTLPVADWDDYLATIASPPAPTPELRKLLREPSPWD